MRNDGNSVVTESDALDPAYAADLVEGQASLQKQAQQVIDDLDLERRLATVGRVVRNGSFVTGLMVWRDVDVSVYCPGLSRDAAFDALRPIVTHPRIAEFRFLNQTGSNNPMNNPADDRYFSMLNYRSAPGDDWKIDVSFWTAAASREEIWSTNRILRQLTTERRLAILWIKDVWHRLPTYRSTVFSTDIYDAVLERGVRSPRQFEQYLLDCGRSLG